MKSVCILIFGFIILVTGGNARGRSQNSKHALSLHIGYVQIKDQINYGLSFGGLDLSGNYEFRYGTDKLDLIYGAAMGIGAVHNKGVGLLLQFKPLDGYAGLSLISDAGRRLSLGPYLSSYFMWQLYPELQSGHLFWYSSYELGPRLRATLPIRSWEINITASMAFLSLNSRPEYTTEQYYYSSTFSDFVKNPHSNMKTGYPGAVNHAEIYIAMERPERKMSFGYQFEYIGYRDTPSFQYMTHSIILKWKIGSSQY